MQHLIENWLVLSKMTWGILEIFTRTLEIQKMGLWWDLFIQSRKCMSLKLTGEFWCHGNEKWSKIWRGIDLSVQNWHEEFDKSWHEHLKNSKIWPLMVFFWTKYIMFDLKRYRGVMLGSTEYWCNIWRKTDSCFENWHEEL